MPHSVTVCRSDTVSSRLERQISLTDTSSFRKQTFVTQRYNQTEHSLPNSLWRFHLARLLKNEKQLRKERDDANNKTIGHGSGCHWCAVCSNPGQREPYGGSGRRARALCLWWSKHYNAGLYGRGRTRHHHERMADSRGLQRESQQELYRLCLY